MSYSRYNVQPSREGIVAEQDMIIMSRREAKRLHIIHQTLDKKFTQAEAASAIGLSDRQVRRIIKRLREEGDEGICHRSRGKASNRQIPHKIKNRALELFKTRYADFNLVHATEKLFEVHDITLSDETLRLWLTEAEITYKKRRAKKHRQRRERKACFGELVQIDGSHHDWFEGRGPVCVFMGYIDDATNTVYGRFYDYEGTMPAMDSMKRYVKRYGIPKSVYLDKHTTYKSWAEPTIEEQLNDQKSLSHFEKSLAELAVEVIHANSPQAKGRVERLFKTLQDRLVKEMRLLGIKSVDEANEFLVTYLPKYNRQFKKKADNEADLHRPAVHARELDRILCIKEERVVRNDFTLAYDGRFYQITEPTRAQKIMVEERLDGTLHISYKGRDLRYREIIKRPLPQAPELFVVIPERKAVVPSSDHPWKRPYKAQRRRQEQTVAP
jgi:transposase